MIGTDTAVKERPILFSTALVCAILDGRKTVTRRVMRPQPEIDCPDEQIGWTAWNESVSTHDTREEQTASVVDEWMCPYGYRGCRLWVRETWAPIPASRPAGYWSNPDLAGKDFWYRATDCLPSWGGRWRPSIHMPRRACRLTLEVESIRTERLQSITEEEAIAEGAQCAGFPASLSSVGAFAKKWDELNAKRGYPWESNPWVWRVEFRRVESSHC